MVNADYGLNRYLYRVKDREAQTKWDDISILVGKLSVGDDSGVHKR